MGGGSRFTVYDPIIIISTQVALKSTYLTIVKLWGYIHITNMLLLQSELVYCLAVVKSAELNIIGRKSLILS
jgi:hypothetical protein